MPGLRLGTVTARPLRAAAQAQVATETTGLVGDFDVYSDEPFPPLASTAATLETPTFSKRRRYAARIAGRSEGSTR